MTVELTFLGLAIILFLSAIIGYFIGFLFGARESEKDTISINDRIMLYKSRYEISDKINKANHDFVNEELFKVSQDIEKTPAEELGGFFKQGYRLACLTILQRMRGEE